MAFDLKVFNQDVYTAMTEVAAQQVDLFNQATGGALMLVSAANQGNFTMEASFSQISNLVRKRDVDNGDSAVTSQRLKHLQNNSVKVAAGTPPIVWEPAQYEWIQRSPTEAASVIAEQLAVGLVQDQLNSLIAAVAGAVSSNANVTTDVSAATGDKTVTPTNMVTAASKFGDRSSRLVAWIMHSKSMHDLYANALQNAERLFSYGDVNILRDPFGRLLIMTDAPALFATTGSGETAVTKYKVLGLVNGAGMIEDNGDFYATMQEKTGTENIQRVYQAEWSYNVGMLGYSYKETAGNSPNDTTLGTGTNWEQTATDIKDTAGVALITL